MRLTFTPVVLSGGLINLRVATEVSQLSTQGQINANGFTIPALTVRPRGNDGGIAVGW